MNKKLLVAAPLVLAIALSPLASFAGGSKEKGEKPLKISHGEEVQISEYVVEGKTTIFDFTSKFCPPCERISPMLDKLHADRADVVIVKVDINRPDVRGIDWRSPVARQYNLNSIPHFKVYGPDGKLQVEGDEAYEVVTKMIGG